MKKITFVFLFSVILLSTFLTTCNEEHVRLSKVAIGSSASEITEITATVDAVVVDIGSGATAYGLCWSPNEMPTVSDLNDNKQEGGNLVKGQHPIPLTGLKPLTTYYVRAYIMEGAKEIYSLNGVSFSTKAATIDQLPEVNTNVIEDFTHNTATMGGDVIDEGAGPVRERGVCWSKSSERPPDILSSDSHRPMGAYIGNFFGSIDGLSPGTEYYVWAYARNDYGTDYGSTANFRTKDAPYISITSPAQNSLWEMGFSYQINWSDNLEEWSDNLEENVKIELLQGGTTIREIGLNLLNTYDWMIPEDLTMATDYTIRISSVNYPSISAISQSFEIFGKITDYDGNKYRIVKIGNQWWMRENLRAEHYSNGTRIRIVQSPGMWSILAPFDFACCYFDNMYHGLLYTWLTAMKGMTVEGVQGVCPDGWHLPTDQEWKVLEAELGVMESDIDKPGWRGTDEGSELKETGTSRWETAGGTNSSGFTATGSGYRTDKGDFKGSRSYAQFWTSTETEDHRDAWYRKLKHDSSTIYRSHFNKHEPYGRSVRCIKD